MTSTVDAGRAVDAPPDADPPGFLRRWAVGICALVAVLLAVAVPLAPVTVSDPVVSWPRAGELPRSTTLALTPPRPVSLAVTLPCAALAGAATPVDVLRTMPTDAPEVGQGLLVAVSGAGPARRVDVAVSGTSLLSAPLGALGPCSALGLRVDGSGASLTRDGAPLAAACAACAGVEPPEVAQLATALPPAAAAGTSVVAHTDDRYASSPSTIKTVLLVAELVALAVLAALLARRPGRPRGPDAARGSGRVLGVLRREGSLADLVVLGVSAAWVVLGPVNYDDSWYPLMARGAGTAGAMANGVYMFNTAEAPFVAAQDAMAVWGGLGGWSLVWMRLLPLLYGLAVWVLLRTYLRRTLTGLGTGAVRHRWVPWALLVAHLVWWLPYGVTLRPETLIVLLSAVVLVAVERAGRAGGDRGGAGRGPLPAVAVAVAAAALSATCSPTGLVAVAPLVVELPRAWAWWRTHDGRARAVAAAVVAAAASVAVPVGFGDATLGDALEAAAVHAWYYPTVPWYDELVHYEALLRPGEQPWGRRGPILLTLAALLVVAIGSGRREATDDGLRRVLLHSAATTGLAFGLLAVSPTKWVLHFPAVAASSTVLLAVAFLRAALPARDRALATTAGVGVLAVAASITFAGTNVWRPFSDRGQPFSPPLVGATALDESLFAPHLGPVFLRNPLVWVAAALLAVVWARVAARRFPRAPRPGPERAVLGAVALALVLGMLAVFVAAPLRQFPGWTVATSNALDVAHGDCGVEEQLSVLEPSAVPLGAPVGPAALSGDFVSSDTVPAPHAVPGLGTVWHDDVPGVSGRGGVVSPWYPVPAGALGGATGATDVVVPLLDAGATDRRLTVELADGAPGAYRTIAERALDPAPHLGGRSWHELPLSLVDLGRPTALRVVVAGGSPAVAPVAVAQPRLVRPMPVTPLIAGRPVRADQMSSSFWPCVDQVFVRHGVAPPAAVVLQAGDIGDNFTGLSTSPTLGGAWRTDALGTTSVRIPTALPAGGPPAREWFTVDVEYRDLPVGGVDVAAGTRRKAGTERGPTLAREPYVGVDQQGSPG